MGRISSIVGFLPTVLLTNYYKQYIICTSHTRRLQSLRYPFTEVQARWLEFVSKYIFDLESCDPHNLENLCAHAGREFQKIRDGIPKSAKETKSDAEKAEAHAEAFVHWSRSSSYARTPLVDVIAQIVAGRRITKSLDLACGQCNILAFLRKQKIIKGRIVGLDAASKMIEDARALMNRCGVNAEFHVGLLDNLPFRDIYREMFDLVFCLDGLQWCDNWRESLKQMEGVMARNGLAILVFQPDSVCPHCVLEEILSQNLRLAGFDMIDGGSRCLVVVEK